jgi:transposase InsO family protein
VKYACIAEHRGWFAVTMMCRVLRVSRAGFYAAQGREPSERSQRRQRLLLEIRSIHKESKQRYGSPRVHEELCAREFRCSENQVALLMREDGLRAKKRRRFRVTTNSNHSHAPAENVLDRKFDVEDQAGSDCVWVSDITYVPTREGWLYLAIILDLATRMVVGWSLKRTLDRSLSLNALRMALRHRRPLPGLLHHSDRGVQYACADYADLLTTCGIEVSMSRKGNCWDNAVAESFFATLEWELIEDADWHTREEARRAISEYIEIWYNRKRRHSSLGGKSPAEYEQQLALTPRAA